MVTQVAFPKIQRQGHFIALVYKVVGFYSIPLLTVATIISLTNVFTTGSLVTITGVQLAWAILFSAAIEVNSVRLFIESAIDDSKTDFGIAIVLTIVAGAALFVEGLQQTTGFDWSNLWVRIVIGFLLAARVVCVMILLGREGRKLGHSLKPQKMEVNELEKLPEKQELNPEDQAVKDEVKEQNTDPLPVIEIEVKPDVLDTANDDQIQFAEDVLAVLKTYPKVYSKWLVTGQKTATIEDVMEVTGISRKMISNRLNDGTLKRSGRNADLIRISTVIEWLKGSKIAA